MQQAGNDLIIVAKEYVEVLYATRYSAVKADCVLTGHLHAVNEKCGHLTRLIKEMADDPQTEVEVLPNDMCVVVIKSSQEVMAVLCTLFRNGGFAVVGDNRNNLTVTRTLSFFLQQPEVFGWKKINN